jgi:hypothetical protein
LIRFPACIFHGRGWAITLHFTFDNCIDPRWERRVDPRWERREGRQPHVLLRIRTAYWLHGT